MASTLSDSDVLTFDAYCTQVDHDVTEARDAFTALGTDGLVRHVLAVRRGDEHRRVFVDPRKQKMYDRLLATLRDADRRLEPNEATRLEQHLRELTAASSD
jgi:hypothetical protein